MRCGKCGEAVVETADLYRCGCGRIPKTIAGRMLARAEVARLLSAGATDVLDGFISRAGKRFAARLKMQDGKVVFEFPDRNPGGGGGSQIKDGVLRIRAEAFHSGTATFFIDGPVRKSAELSFGLVPARLAECLALITALNYARHALGREPAGMRLSLNNLDLSRYILRERKPRDAEVQAAVAYALRLLGGCPSWSAHFEPKKKPRLYGWSGAQGFPRGVFPWLKAELHDLGNVVDVRLPDDPAVVANFRASIRTAVGENGEFRVPAAAGRAVRAWLASVAQ